MRTGTHGVSSGLSGTAIPIGARILSVVDCLTFDVGPALQTGLQLKPLKLGRRRRKCDPQSSTLFCIHDERNCKSTSSPVPTPKVDGQVRPLGWHHVATGEVTDGPALFHCIRFSPLRPWVAGSRGPRGPVVAGHTRFQMCSFRVMTPLPTESLSRRTAEWRGCVVSADDGEGLSGGGCQSEACRQ